MQVDKQYLLDTLKEIMAIDSPSGFCAGVIARIGEMAKELGYEFETTRKGCGVITVPGHRTERVTGLSAHVDTLGAMVRSVAEDGSLRFTRVGGPILPTLDGEYCRIITREGKVYTGTFLSQSPAGHVFSDSASRKRDEENMYVRLDEVVKKKDDTLALGIMAGDYICIDPKTVVTESGFVKSRFIDDKGSVACLMALLKLLRDENLKPAYTLKVFISVFEEVGHGASYIPEDIEELVAVDMGCVGSDLSCTEYDVSICAKDSGGPYSYDVTGRLMEAAKAQNVSYAVDIYPYYGSDVGAALQGGNDITGGLIGPGVHASHGMERTHYTALEGTVKLLVSYLGCR